MVVAAVNSCVLAAMKGVRALLGSTRGVSSGTSKRLRTAVEPKCCGRKVVVDDASVLLAMLRVPRTIWYQTTFVIKDVAMMQRIQAQVPGTCWHCGYVTATGKVLQATLTRVSWSRGVQAQW